MNEFRFPDAFLTALNEVHMDPAFLFRKSGLPPDLCSPGDWKISTEQFFRLWYTLGEVSDDPALGLKMGTLNPRPHAIVAAQHARTFGDALRDLARSTMLFCFSQHMRIVKTEDECSIEFSGALLNEAAPALFLDSAFALALEMGRRGTQQPLHPLRVELTRTARGQEIQEAHYGCRVRFKARRNAILFRTSDLELPFATYNAELLATLSPQLDGEIELLKAQLTTSSRAKWVLKRLLGRQLTPVHAVAKMLGMSSRTLQRRITEESSSFRQLLSDARRELARVYLQHPSLEFSNIATLLHYEDPNSFLRAFRAWEGVTPTEWRTMQRLGSE